MFPSKMTVMLSVEFREIKILHGYSPAWVGFIQVYVAYLQMLFFVGKTMSWTFDFLELLGYFMYD